MAKLFEIDAAILECVDMETGEIIDMERLEELQLERDKKIENVALWYKNLLSDAEQYKAVKDDFAKKEKAAKNKAESLKRWLDNALHGEKYKSTLVNITYRKGEKLAFNDVAAFIKWAISNRDDLLRYKAPEIDVMAVKAALKDGSIDSDNAYLLSGNNIQIK